MYCTQSIVRESAKAARLWERTRHHGDTDFYEMVCTRDTLKKKARIVDISTLSSKGLYCPTKVNLPY